MVEGEALLARVPCVEEAMVDVDVTVTGIALPVFVSTDVTYKTAGSLELELVAVEDADTDGVQHER